MIFVAFIILIFIVRIIQYPHLRQQVIDHMTGKSTRSIHTRILKTIVFFLFTAGLFGLTFYSIYKMIYDPPTYYQQYLNQTQFHHPYFFCPSIDSELIFITADYHDSFNGFNDIELFMQRKTSYNLNDGFSIITGNNGRCHFFDGRLTSKPNDSIGGYYHIQFQSINSTSIVIFIGDTHDKMDWTLLIPEGNVFNDVGVEILNDGGILQYTEGRRQVLDGSYTYRSFLTSIIKNAFEVIKVDEQIISIGNNSTEKGGYLSIWVIFAFLFGGRRANPFGFVTRFVFIKQDREKLLKELEKMKNDRKSKISTLEREVDNATETNKPSNQDELRNLLARYYVDMDFYEHAIKSFDV
ncbi:unnamed protein product [Rhizophagus irregularis]|nr:unnamed protein product [Rhizophagus irregularis]